jgi:uncharacterized membrane protein YdbT with pleckstrin-like domain
MNTEQIIWTSKPLLPKSLYIIGIVGGLLTCGVVSLLVCYDWIKAHFTTYSLLTSRIRIQSGILSRSEQEIQLWKITDVAYDQPFLMRLFGRAQVIITSVDVLSRNVKLVWLGAKEAYHLKERIQTRQPAGTVIMT